ncbi:MAG TPA: branched-chain amino acid ABC transporter permease [Usitatibacter sp.]|jgi:branched-chain amino acid transport system permease protein|nr:branched-chain amino acid ABC transporter permease [Usitatibacter sp.]
MTARGRAWLAAALLLLLPWIPGMQSDSSRSLLTQMAIAAVFALSYNLLLGQTGLLSFGHAVYFGLGGYASIHFLRAINGGLPIPVPFVPLAGALAGLSFGMVFGALTTRRGGTVFALISLGLGEWVHASSLMLPSFFGGEEGVTASRTKGPHLDGLDMASQLQVYYVTAAWLLISAALMYAFMRTPVGRLANAVRDNPERVEFIGYNPQRVRFIVFSVSAMFAGLAGGLHAINYEIVAAESLSAARSGAVLLMVYIGGVDHFLGAVLGAVAITWLQVSLSDYTTAWLLYLGLLFMGVVAFVPGGLAGLAMMHLKVLRTPAMRAIARSYLVALPFAILASAGLVTLIEIVYRRATQPEAGALMKLFWIPMDTAKPWPWIGAAGAAGIGAFALARAWPRIAAAWAEAGEETHARA